MPTIEPNILRIRKLRTDSAVSVIVRSRYSRDAWREFCPGFLTCRRERGRRGGLGNDRTKENFIGSSGGLTDKKSSESATCNQFPLRPVSPLFRSAAVSVDRCRYHGPESSTLVAAFCWTFRLTPEQFPFYRIRTFRENFFFLGALTRRSDFSKITLFLLDDRRFEKVRIIIN